MRSVVFQIVVASFVVYGASADEILGCNGFIKSDVPIIYSSVEVQLFTKQGALKDHTDCAPNNGYYFLPIYDKGEYVLKVSPPHGWKFEPSEVPLLFDGATDPCSKGKDINFNFLGFAVDGQVVSSGFGIGPKDVTVELFAVGSSKPTLITTTTVDGKFLFSPVLPGSYKVKISHPRWKISKNEVAVIVKDGNGKIPAGSLAIAGYDVTGTVTSDNQPITGVSFVLFSRKKESEVSGCDSTPLPGFTTDPILGTVHLICHVSSDARGVFNFPQVSPGEYVLVPHYKGSKSTKFDVHPRSLRISVGHNSLHLPSPFQVKGFTVAGKVLWSPGGKPMSGATVYLNNKIAGKTGSDGVYSLESMRAGTYKLKVEADDVVFKETEIKVSSTSLPDLVPATYKVCGHFHSPSSSGPYRIELTSEDSTISEVTTDSKGSYCLYLAPGKYNFTPVPDSKQLTNGLLFSPSKRIVEVVDEPVKNIDFSQLRSNVKGKIVCMTQCPLITVNLKPKGQGSALQTIAKNGRYEFTEVMPGDYDIYLEPGFGWCWDKESQSLAVIDETTEVPTFTQSGFTVTIVSSHSTTVTYYSEGQPNDKLKLEVSPGSTHICVPKSTPYIFQPISCHGYEEPQVRWVTGLVSLNAITHANSFFLIASEGVNDLLLNIEPLDSAESRHPKVIKLGAGSATDEGVKYEFTLQLKPNEGLKITPVAGVFLFTPQSAEVRGHTDCINTSKALFSAEKGQVITGSVLSGDNKGIGGVSITIKDEMGAVIATQTTDANGSYKFPPLKPAPNTKIIAEKEGYVLTGLSKWGDFSAHKLAEIIVSVSDVASKEKLQGVLLSVSGGKNYRRNAQTNAEGTMSFLSLSPGEYFLKPMMKEYRFHPQNKIINVKEGATVTVSLSGERVAYSGIGEVMSLNGEGEGGVVVEAIGVGTCSKYQEEATSSDAGTFRIRGLKPECEYNVRVKDEPDVNHHILKSGQDNVTIKVSKSDVSGLKLYALRPSTRVDVMVYVLADRSEDLKTLRLRLTREDSPELAVSVIKLSEYKASSSGYVLTSVMIALPPLPADGRSYVLQLESSLPLGTHEYTNRPVHFKATGSLKVFRMSFSPNLKSRDPELSQSSYLVLPLLILFGLIFYNKDTVIGLSAAALERTRQPAQLSTKATADESLLSDSFTDFPKKKSKSRKT
uniref:Nodal modulator 1 n=1 Tax=Lygus hesperus TaxID=30085 RepID=A0A146KZQ6_LYGHE